MLALARRRARLVALVAPALAALGAPSTARADLSAGPVTFKITETSIVNYHFDNRDNLRENDNYGEWLNRLNVQANSGPFTLAIRLDSALYWAKPNPNRLAEDAVAEAAEGGRRTQAQLDRLYDSTVTRYGRDLSTRYVNTVFPSKISLSYTRSGLDLTVGDYYAQLGKGLVLAMRKNDELAADNTLRGAKLDWKPDLGPMRLSATLLGGLSNPIRVDEVSGRQLTQSRSGVGGAFFPMAPQAKATAYVDDPQPTFAPDLIVGGRVEHGTKDVQLGVQGMHLTRPDAPFLQGPDSVSPSRSVKTMHIVSMSANVPNIADHGSFSAEVATQTLGKALEGTGVDGTATSEETVALLRRLSGGYAAYAQLSGFEGPFTVTVEGKHYERFFPVQASVSPSASEFRTLQYNGVPTTELIYSDTQFEQFNTCVTGGRLRVDYRANEAALVYATVGRYVTYGERSTSCGQARTVQDDGTLGKPEGRSDSIRNDVWDPFVGFEINVEGGRSHAFASTGIRVDDSATPVPYDGLTEETNIYYREHWMRYDLVKKIAGPFSVQAAGFHRYRFMPLRSPLAWREGENYLSLIYSPKVTAAFGYEYTTFGGETTSFYNGLLQYRFTSDTQVRAFVGQTRPALRCVSGVCRQFPAFEGAKLEAVVRF